MEEVWAEINGRISHCGRVKARGGHTCYLCQQEIYASEFYYQWTEPETGFQQKICSQHVKEKEVEDWKLKRSKMEEMKRKGHYVWLQTDAGGHGKRWAFVAFIVENGERREIHRDRGEVDLSDIIPGEGFAVIKALEWLKEAEEKEVIPNNIPLLISNDNSAIRSKIDTGSERGIYHKIWEKLQKMTAPHWREGRIFLGGEVSEAHNYV